ncbi:probable proline--tRNA ligase, mitochondrial isoform X2 [Pieris rapae]|uniref:probable proline--tRNA ligase, mitochondrial isoform X2 n=1 Tax=Pieris rapae TaxID=64459 RepID=UPI001E27AFE1|nr:probable proline--tRNA ligase, mitochondrial isoform X2 [Pieris rapae]
MRYLSQIFQPVITIPKGAIIKNTEITCKSQKLLLECGLIRPTTSGFFTILPLARRALDKLELLVNSCLESVQAQRISLPCLTSANLWEKTGRLDSVGSELFTIKDRHDKKYLLAPTHEEAIADLIADVGPLSHKQLPLLLYQITNKYRDELRPKHGLLRAREFTMMDLYGFHSNIQCAHNTYSRVTEVYRRLFDLLDLPVHRLVAPTGEMGGSLSHEWQLPALAGEDSINICPSCSHVQRSGECEKCASETDVVQTVEVGHTFILGTKYSEPLQAKCIHPDSNPSPLIMSCYGIGITRLLAASLEALSSDSQIRWPKCIAPFAAIVIGPKEGSKEWSKHGLNHIEGVARKLDGILKDDVLLDDRHTLTIGKRLLMADRMGYPHIIVCGRNSIETPPRYELYTNGRREPILGDINELMDMINGVSDTQRDRSRSE